jgi:hypothetical protein
MGQHFVPRHYLRQFRIGTTEQIAMALVAPFRWIGAAGITGQCQHGEFYGKDSGIDRIYQDIEGAVSSPLRSICAKRTWTTDEMFAVRMLAVSLHIRTKKAIEATKVPMRLMADHVLKHAIEKGELPAPEGGWRPGLMDFVGVPSDLILRTIACDLEAATLRLKTLTAPPGAFFITSDHPSVALNQFGSEHDAQRSFAGFSKAGFQLLLPLSPQVTALFYDPTVYRVGKPGSTCVPLNASDVETLNSLQIQSADKCVYCHDPSQEDRVAGLCRDFATLRISLDETVKRYPTDRPNEELLHIKHSTVRLPRPLRCISYVKRLEARPGDRRNPLHSELVERIVEDLRENPNGGDIDSRMEKVFAAFGRR